MKTATSRSRLSTVDAVLKALADPTRLRIVALLSGGEVCVCHIHEALGILQTKASRHLAYLRRAGIVEARKEGPWVHYRLASLSDGVSRTLVTTVAHCVGHVDTVARDRKRLEKATGCCVQTTDSLPDASCCSDLSR